MTTATRSRTATGRLMAQGARVAVSGDGRDPLRPPDANLHGPRWALSIAEAVEFRRRADRGWTPGALAVAYGISKRTAYRYMARTVVLAEVAGWRAAFSTGLGAPRQVGRWERVP